MKPRLLALTAWVTILGPANGSPEGEKMLRIRCAAKEMTLLRRGVIFGILRAVRRYYRRPSRKVRVYSEKGGRC